jgi:hypothetical protein
VVPDDAIKKVGIRRFQPDDAVAWLDGQRDVSARSLAEQPQ